MSKLKILSLVTFASTVISAANLPCHHEGYHEGYSDNFSSCPVSVTNPTPHKLGDGTLAEPVETKFVSIQKKLTALRQELNADVDAGQKKAIEDQIARLEGKLKNTLDVDAP
jgi:hypothetical protein